MTDSKSPTPDIFSAIGRAIHDWAAFEDALFHLFVFVLGVSERRSAIVWFSFKSFVNRIDLLDDLIQERFRGRPELVYWNCLKRAIRALSIERNHVAHTAVDNPVTIIMETKPRDGEKIVINSHAFFEEPKVDKHAVKVTSFYETKNQVKTRKAFNTDKIVSLSDLFRKLRRETSGFRLHLSEQTPASQKYQQPVSDPDLEIYCPKSRLPLKQKRQQQSSPQ